MSPLAGKTLTSDGPSSLIISNTTPNPPPNSPYKKDIPNYKRAGWGQYLVGAAGRVNLEPPPSKSTELESQKKRKSTKRKEAAGGVDEIERYYHPRFKVGSVTAMPTGPARRAAAAVPPTQQMSR
jgi:hypothetical protein